MDNGYGFHRNLYPKVAACHHGSVGGLKNRVDVGNRFGLFDFGDDSCMVSALVQNRAELVNVRGVAHKAQADPVDIFFECHIEIRQVFFGQAWQRYARIWQVHTLFGLEGSALNRFGHNLIYAVG